MMTVTSIQPKLVLAKNLEAYNEFLNNYDFDEDDYIFIGNTEEDLMRMTKILGYESDVYGIVLTGDYKKNPIYSTVKMLIDNKRFAIVQIMP